MSKADSSFSRLCHPPITRRATGVLAVVVVLLMGAGLRGRALRTKPVRV